MIPSVEIMLGTYVLSIGAVAFLTFFPLRGPKEEGKAAVVVLSLLLLTAVGCFRFHLETGFLQGGLLGGTALNMSLLLGTKLDPLTAVVHWEDDRHQTDITPAVAESSRTPGPGDVRKRIAWPTLLLFGISAALLMVIFPDLYFPAL